MDLSLYKHIKIGGHQMKTLAIDDVQIWKCAYVNQVPLSINADGSIYNGGLGYKNGYRIRSGGEESATAPAACTGFIPVSAGDVVRIYPVNPSQLSASGTGINVSDSSFNNIGQAASNGDYGIFASSYSAYGWKKSVVAEGNGVYRWVVPPAASGVAYIRVSIYDQQNGAQGANMIVTVNEEIT